MAQIFYFAYGSNMNSEQMTRRCPDSEFFGVATLHGYRLIERRNADIDKDPDGSVPGVLYTLSDADLNSLDGYEGIRSGAYIRYPVNVECNGKIISAYVYEMTPETKELRNGIPYSKEYRERCSSGAREHNVPDLFATSKP